MQLSRGKCFRLVLALAVVSVVVGLIAGCGGTGDKQTQVSGPEQYIRYNVGAEPETLDPATATGLAEGTIIMAFLEGLTRYDGNQRIAPALAERWEVSSDGLEYTFRLRDAKWSNGDPVTANDFVFSWLRVLDPNTGSEYAYQLYYIKGAEEYNTGDGKREDVAISAPDPRTLRVVLKGPAPQFLSLTALHTLYPVNPRAAADPDWARSPETYVACGPFKMVKWSHEQKIEAVRNPDYWDAPNVKLEKLDFYLVSAATTGYNMYRTGQIDFQDDVPLQEMARLKASGDLRIFPDCSLYSYAFNTSRKPFRDLRVRKALAMAVDRQAIIDNVLRGEQKAAFGFIPYGFMDHDGRDFQQNSGNAFFKEDLTEAKRLLAEAGYPNGRGFPKVKILFNSSEEHQKIAEAIQQMWRQNLGIDVGLVAQEWQVYLSSFQQGDFDIARAGWSPDYMDPVTFFDTMVTNGGNNFTGWSNPRYDALVERSKTAGDQKTRMEAMHEAEKILMAEMPVMPIYYYTNPNLIKQYVRGVIIPPFGTLADFKWAYVE